MDALNGCTPGHIELKIYKEQDSCECCEDEQPQVSFSVIMCGWCGWEPATEMFSTANNPISSPRLCKRCWERKVNYGGYCQPKRSKLFDGDDGMRSF